MKKILDIQGRKEIKFIPLFIVISFFIIPNISATDLECHFEKNFIKDGVVIPVYENNSFDGIFFDVICSNNLKDQRILSLSITNASPIELFNALPKKTIEFIRIYEKDKIMWSSEIISTKNLNQTIQDFSVSIIGISEKNWTLQKIEIKDSVIIQQEKNQVTSFGAVIWPSHPVLGIFIVVFLIFFLFFYLYNAEIGKKINGWKRKNQMRKMDKIKQQQEWNNKR